MKIWQTTYKGHDVVIMNGWFRGERLLIDGELQDIRRGFSVRSLLAGRIRTGEGAGEPVRVCLSGWLVLQCDLFIDDRHVPCGPPPSGAGPSPPGV